MPIYTGHVPYEGLKDCLYRSDEVSIMLQPKMVLKNKGEIKGMCVTYIHQATSIDQSRVVSRYKK